MNRPRDYHHLHVKSKGDTSELIYKTETNAQTKRTTLWLPKRESEGRDKLGG